MLRESKYYLARVGVCLMTVALIVGIAGCFASQPENLEIRTWYDLDAIRNNLSAHYILMNDLDSTTAGYVEMAGPTANEGKGWHPIVGAGGSPSFTGTFDGQGYKIRDVYINLPGIGYVGLFSILGEGGVIQNIAMVNANVTCTAYAGGVVGANLGTVSYSYFAGSVSSLNWAGGLVGFNSEGATVGGSYSTGNITSDYGAGGLAGANGGTVSSCYSTSSVTGNAGVGGLLGANNGTVNNSYSTGRVSGSTNVGGLVGYSEGTVNNSFWDVQTSGQSISDGGTGLSTSQMKSISTFLAAGWNIVAVGSLGDRDPAYVWNIVNGVSYPFLGWQP